jgi:hypothetical protein
MYFYDMLKIPAEYDRDTSMHNSWTNLTTFGPTLILCVSAGICQTALVEESRTIKTQIGKQNRWENGRSAWEALYDTTQ